MSKRPKIKFIFAFILVALMGISIILYDYNKVQPLLVNSTENKESEGNNYKKFEGEKIPFSAQEEELNGEWGNLKITPFIIEPTQDFLKDQTYINDLYNVFSSSSQWVFKGVNLEEIRQLFKNAGLDESACHELLINTAKISDGKGYITTPPDSVLWSLTPENRASLYPLIGKYSDNTMYLDPVYYGSSNIDEWFYNSGLKDEVVENLKKLIYIKDGISYISDIHLVLPLIDNGEERIKLLQILYRTRALDVKLEVKEGQDVSGIADYWSRFGGKVLIESMLEGISRIPGGGEIDISRLLPQIPQSRLNTYSGLKEFETDYKDCHWTTINFFNKETDESYYNAENLLSVMNEISEPLNDSNPGFGDVVSIFDEDNELTHSCTYIADNMVLTKNGIGNLHPFVITYLDKTAPLYGYRTDYYSRTVGDTHSVDLKVMQ